MSLSPKQKKLIIYPFFLSPRKKYLNSGSSDKLTGKDFFGQSMTWAILGFLGLGTLFQLHFDLKLTLLARRTHSTFLHLLKKKHLRVCMKHIIIMTSFNKIFAENLLCTAPFSPSYHDVSRRPQQWFLYLYSCTLLIHSPHLTNTRWSV